MSPPREFLEDVVRPNVADFHDKFDSVRHAYNAVVSIDSLAAHLYHWCRTNAPAEVAGISRQDDGYREVLAIKNPDFSLIRDIAKAQKHVRLTRGSPQVTSAAQMNVRGITWGEGNWGEGRWGGVPQVIIDKDSGSFAFVESLVDLAISFFEGEMTRLNV
jgi:hypothetical protein